MIPFHARLIAIAILFTGLVSLPSVGESTGSRVTLSAPNIAALPNDAYGWQVRLGRALVAKTYAYIGPFVADPAKRFAGNDLACGDCHLEAGTKNFGLPLVGLYNDFPRYSALSGEDISIEDRINSCMTRSMSGHTLPIDAPDMRALAAYIKFLASGVPKDRRVPNDKAGQLPYLTRAADPVHGKAVYAQICAACHQSDGAGLPNNPKALVQGYAIPPLWGDESFNDGAGMARVITLANFVHSNMPLGASHTKPMLSPEEAWDVAAYVDSQKRPHRADLDRDFSADLLDKPVDTAYGPYADHFSEKQHKYGPFGAIVAEIADLKAAKDKAH